MDYDEIELVSTESVVTEIKKNNNNVLLSLF